MNPEGTESTRSIEFLAWLEVNKKRLLVGAGVVAVVASVIAVYRTHAEAQERKANAALLAVAGASLSGESRRPAAGDFLKVGEQYSGTKAARRALLLGAEALYREGKYAEAQAQFEKAQASLGSDNLAGTAAYGMAVCLDALGKTNEALAAYQDVVTRHASSAAAGQAKLALAGLQEARGEFAQALRTYNEMTNRLVSGWSSEALMRRENLLSRHPELVPTNAPAAAAPLAGAPGALTNAAVP